MFLRNHNEPVIEKQKLVFSELTRNVPMTGLMEPM